MSYGRIRACPVPVVVGTAAFAILGLFLTIANLAEQTPASRLGLQALLFVPFLICVARNLAARSS